MKQYLSLKASAGTGKTFALSARYISLLLKGVKSSEILCLTFTNKAANEMKQRIVSTILSLESEKNKTLLDVVSSNLGISRDQAIDKKNSILSDFLNSQINVYTIDKFVNMILKEFSGYAQIGDNYQIRKINKSFFLYHFLNWLDEKQSDLLINFIYNEGKSLDSLLDVFKSLEEKNEHFGTTYIDKSSILQLKNCILDLAYRLKNTVENSPNVTSSAKKAVDFVDFESFIEKSKTWLYKDSFCEFLHFKKIKSEEAELNFVSLKNACGEYFRLTSQNNLWHIFEIYKYFLKFKQRFYENYGQFEFNDITNLVYKLLNQGIDKDFLQFRLDMKFNHLLIDEFQDTSLIQYKILKPLISEIVSGQSYGYKTFFYVGDVKQAIYRFRNGKKELFDSLQNEFPNIETEELFVNFRSSNTVVNFCNQTFGNLDGFDYSKQISNSSRNGLVKIKNISDNWQNELLVEVKYLLDNNISPNNIAILTFANDEVGQIYDFFREYAPEIELNTETTNLLINQSSPKAIINIFKYFYFEDAIYLKNFNALCNKPLDNDIEIERDLSDLSRLCVMIGKKFGIFDDYLKAFLDVVSSFSSIVDFVYEIDFCDTIINSSERNGVLAMTIFKSKGLEFDNVIVLDRIKKVNNFTNPILFDYDGIELRNIFYSLSGLEEFDQNYATAKENEKSFKKNDLFNILYVALTRAKTNMIVLKKEKNSEFDKLNLIPCENGSLEVCNNENPKMEFIKAHTPIFAIQKQNIKTTNKHWLGDYASEYFGVITHYILENISAFDEKSLFDILQIAKFKFYGFVEDVVFDEIAQKLLILFNDEKFKILVNNAKYALKEQPLVFNGELKIIDLYLDFVDFGVVIDYKTGKKNEDNFIQVAGYKKALTSILSKKIIAFILYIDDKPSFFEVS